MRVASKTLAGAASLKLVENGKGWQSSVFLRWQHVHDVRFSSKLNCFST